VIDRVHRWAFVIAVGLGVFLIVAVGGLWLQGWFQ